MTTGDVVTRRLIGWRVRWEWRDTAGRRWLHAYTPLTNLVNAWSVVERLRSHEGGRRRNVRVMRVYRRRRTP